MAHYRPELREENPKPLFDTDCATRLAKGGGAGGKSAGDTRIHQKTKIIV